MCLKLGVEGAMVDLPHIRRCLEHPAHHTGEVGYELLPGGLVGAQRQGVGGVAEAPALRDDKCCHLHV